MTNSISQGLRLGQKVSKGFRKWLKDKRGKCVNCAKSVMQIFAESLKSLMQIFVESAESAKPIFATYATYASANLVGKESCKSTVRYALWSRISLIKPLQNPYLTLTCFRLSLGSNLSRLCLASLICLCMLTVGVGNVWGADPVATLDPVDGESYVVAFWNGTKYYALPNIGTSSSTYDGTEITVNASGYVTSDNPPLWKFEKAASGTYKGDWHLTYKKSSTTYYLYKNGTGNSNYNISAQTSSSTYWRFTKSSNKYNVVATDRGTTNHTRLTYSSSKWKVTGNSSSTYDIILLQPAPAGPTITPSVSSLTEVGYSTADFSQQVKSFTVSGSSLTANVTVTAPTNYEVCKTSGGTYTSSVSFDKGSGTLAASTVYVRLQSGKTAGSYSGDVACTSDGATTKNVAVSGSVPFTVTWKANGTTHATTYVAYATSPGTALGSLPDDPDAGDYCGDVFYGWYDGASYSHASVAPSIIGTSTKITSDKTYVAVFADEEDGGTTTVYKLVSSLTNAKDYVFVTRNTAGSGYALSSSVTTGTSVTITTSGDDKIVSGTPANTIIWTAATGWNLQNKNTSTYLVINGGSFGLNASAGTLYWSTDYGLYGKSGSGKTSYYVQCSTGTFSKSESGSTTNRVWAYEKTTVSVKTHTNFKTTCCTSLGSINGSFTSSNLSQSSGVLTATLPSASKNANATSYRFTLYNNSDVEITHKDVATGGGDVSTTFSSPDVTAGNTYKVSVTPLVSPQGSFCSTTGTESDKASITMHYTVTLAVNNAEYGSISPTSTLYVASGTSISTSTNTLSVGATNITATPSDPTAQYTYGFTNWSWTPSGATITANTTATANFTRSTRNYNVTTTGITHATASPAIPATVAYGGSISTTITADANYSLPSAITVTGATLDSWNSSTGALSITEVTGDVSITITAVTAMKRIYMNTDGTAGGKWGANSPKFFVHSWGSSDDDAELVAQPCVSNVFYADIPAANTTLLFTRQDPSKGSSIIYKGNDGNWSQSVDITISTNNYFTFNGNWDVSSSGKSGFDAGTYTPDTKTIYLSFCAEWLEDNPLFALYDVTHSTWMSTFAEVGTGCYAGYYIAQVPSCAESVLIGRFNPGTPAPFGWSGENWWGQSVDFTIGSDTYDKITIEGWGTEGDAKDKGYGYLGNFALTQYTISFAGGGGTGSMSSSTNKDCGSDVTLPNVGFTKTGYDFDGWHADVDVKVGGATIPAGNTIANQATIQDIRSNVALTAQWAAKEYTITLDREGASTGSVSVTMTYNSSSHTAITAPTKTGYNFGGWYSGDNGTGLLVMNASGVLQANVDGYTGAGGVWTRTTTPTTLYAKWIAKEYTITLDREGASTGAESVTATYDAGTLAGWSAPSKTGYTFRGYWSGDNGTGTLVISTTGVLQNSVTISTVAWTDGSGHWVKDGGATVYAKWTANVYNITYKDQGDVAYSGNATAGVPTGAPTTHTYGSATALVNGVKDGYRFDGWFTDASCTVSAGSSIGATAMTADFTLYAKWTQVYTVTWSVNGETWSSGVVEGNTHVPGGEQVAALPTAPTSSDCDDAKVFVGWRSTAIDGVSAANPGSIFTTKAASPAITGDVTFYAVFADESGGDEIELTFPDDNSANNGLTSGQYTSTWTAKAGDFSFTIENFNNNNWNPWTYIRCGRKSTASVAKITTATDIDFVVDEVDITIDATNATHLNSAKLQISSSSAFTTTTDMDIDNSSEGEKKLIIASPAKDMYYRIVYDCKNTYSSGNGYVQISKIKFISNLVYSNYVTTCSSCDADATFTNTTPAVSAIGCEAATLTGGLATLGADGCNVSDYGFVIGTSDNPAIGGSGVTKLQVGTTNPTIGADFSYDVDDLTKGTRYYIRAYATNRHGTAYSSSQNFWTKGVSSIAITTAPTKTKYVEGETFDKTGMVVTATMADGSTEDVTSDCTFSPSLSTKLSDQTAVRATYSLCEVDKTADQVINVYTLTVTEGTNDTYGTAGKTDNKVTVTGLGDHKTYTVTVTSGNADKIDNGDGTYTITNATGNVTVRVDYADAAQVKVYYKVDGVTVTGLTRDVYQSETTTLPTASELATEMTAQGMEIPDDSYPNFVGWSETEFGAQTSEPTLVTGTPTINAEKTYYAVYTNLGKKTILPTDFPNGYGDGGDRVIDGVTYYRSGVANPSGSIQFRSSKNGLGYIYSKTSLSYILKIEVSGDNLVVNACSDASGTLDGDAITPVGTAPRVYTFPANKQYFQIKGNGETNTASRIDIYYSPATVEYMTQFCTRYDITGVTKSGTAVTGGTLSSNYNSACEGKSVELGAVVSTGYQFNGWTIKKTDDLTQDVTSTLLGVNASSLTPPAFSMPDYAITVSASITEKELTGWTWKQALPDATQIAIPSPVVLYVGQQARFVLISYDPSDVLAGKKGYDASYTNADLAQDNKAGAYYVTRAKQAQESTTLTLTSTSNSSVQEVINIQIKALPSVTFEDHVHSVVFSAVAATIDEVDKRVVYLTKTTPTTSDFSGTTYNTCEEQHEHLVGWIESSWADEHPNATHSEIAGAGAGVFYTAGASIDVEAQNGKTFYAVWSKIE